MTLYETIESELSGILRGIEYSLEHLPADTSPLFMVLTIGQDKAAFAMLDGQGSKTLEDAVERLRNLYARYAVEWAKYELNLVLCESIKSSSDFHTKVEVDAYFCRKFIIDQAQLGVDLRRLPFIPLYILKQISERPVGAQSFLIRHGMSSELARYAVTPHAKGTEKLIEECMRGDWGFPKWKDYEGALFVAPAAASGVAEVRLKHLAINGFRAYRDTSNFELDADIVVLYGPNGFA